MTNKNIQFAYFGTSDFAVYVLDELKKNNLLPTLIVTTEDKPRGRKLVLSPSPVKGWAEKEKIKYIQPKTLRRQEVLKEIKSYEGNGFDIFIVASYGKIIPKEIIELPKYKTLNVHPSLLPKLRGSSPIQSAILNENETGVTIMKIDGEVDHGPILAQKKLNIDWPPYADELERLSGKLGGEMLADIIPKWINGELKEIEQEHDKATFTKKIEKNNGELNLNDDPEINLRKIRAYNIWPNAFYFEDNKKRIIIKTAHIENEKLIFDKIIPEGRKEMNYKDYLRGIKK